MSSITDQIYKEKQDSPTAFKFDERVAAVFQDMISRSVPGYLQILQMLPTLVRVITQSLVPNRAYNFYDLGCSLGAGMAAISQGLNDENPHKIIGIDNSEAMLEQASAVLAQINRFQHELICQDILDSEFENSALCLMNFTLQFIPLAERDNIIERIYQSLEPGGALILSEKIKFFDTETDKALIDIHHQYKADQGYSKMEIAQKRDAIENVLIPETLDTHEQRLKKAGFRVVTPWVQNLQFLSVLAIK